MVVAVVAVVVAVVAVVIVVAIAVVSVVVAVVSVVSAVVAVEIAVAVGWMGLPLVVGGWLPLLAELPAEGEVVVGGWGGI